MRVLTKGEKGRILHLYDEHYSIRDIARVVRRGYKEVSTFLNPYKQQREPHSVNNNRHVRQVASPDAVGDVPVELSAVGAFAGSTHRSSSRDLSWENDQSSVPRLVNPAVPDGSNVEQMSIDRSVRPHDYPAVPEGSDVGEMSMEISEDVIASQYTNRRRQFINLTPSEEDEIYRQNLERASRFFVSI